MTNQKTILISVLGTGDYKEVVYKFENLPAAAEGKYVVKAIQEIFKPDETLIIMSSRAKETHWPALSNLPDVSPVYIPDGRNDKELWEMFSTIAESVPDNCHLIIDVTHGFRSQPMLMLAIAVYLETIRNISVDLILYGAWEAKDTDSGIAPLINLKAFMDLVKWSYATRAFLETGNASLLSAQILPIHAEAWRTEGVFKPKNLQSFGRTLDKITMAFSAIRPQEVAKYAERLVENIEPCIDDVNNLDKALPFKALLGLIKERFTPMGGEKTDLFSEKGIQIQQEILQFYLNANQYQQAITLARELMVSITCLKQGWDGRNERKRGEDYLNILTALVNERKTFNVELSEEQKGLSEIWSRIRNLRNDINHAAMRDTPIAGETLIDGIKESCEFVIRM